MPYILLLTALFLVSTPVPADNHPLQRIEPAPSISIIIDDLGEQLSPALRVLRMPAALTYSILPHTSHSHYLALLAHDLGKETMLHLPMQSSKDLRLGRGGLTDDMSRKQFALTLRNDLAVVPYVSGINNHMGSLLTQRPQYMQWLMEEILQAGNLYFIDSRTTARSVALTTARQYRVPSLRRNIFLDNIATRPAITRQYEKLLDKARKYGFAIAIGHPYPETLAVLEKELPRLRQYGIQLLPISKMLRFRQQLADDPQLRLALQQVSLTPSKRTLKSVP